MSEAYRLSTILLAHAPGEGGEVTAEVELERSIVAQWDAGVAAWPGVHVTKEELARHLGERVEGPNVLESLRALRGAELYLTCACERGQPPAL